MATIGYVASKSKEMAVLTMLISTVPSLLLLFVYSNRDGTFFCDESVSHYGVVRTRVKGSHRSTTVADGDRGSRCNKREQTNTSAEVLSGNYRCHLTSSMMSS